MQCAFVAWLDSFLFDFISFWVTFGQIRLTKLKRESYHIPHIKEGITSTSLCNTYKSDNQNTLENIKG
jgi:hypothetical protein